MVSRNISLAFSYAAILIASLAGLAFGQPGSPELKDLYTKYQAGRTQLNSWMSNRTAFDSTKKEDLEALSNYSRFVCRGQTFRDRLSASSDPSVILLLELPDNVQKDISQTMIRAFDQPYAPSLLKNYHRTMMEEVEAVLLESKDQFVRLNATRVLPSAALAIGALKRDGKPVLDSKDQAEAYNRQIVLCKKLVESAWKGIPRDDAVLLYSLRGAREAMAGYSHTVGLRTDREKKNLVQPDLAQDMTLLNLVGEIAAQMPSWLSNATPEELEGFRSIRREAIRTLGASGRSKVGAALPALVLGRILAGDLAKDNYRLDELTDVAIGLAGMRTEESYNSDLAASLVGNFLQEFFARHAQKQGIYASFPFVYHAARLNTALQAWDEKPPSPEIKTLVGKAKAALTSLEKKQEPQFQEAELIKTLRDKKPLLLINGDEKSRIGPAQ